MSAPSLNHFETFLCVAKNGSFTQAAKQLGISKAAVSHTIRLLEESLQVPLFIRSTRSIKLTEEGEMLFEQCNRIKIELDIARDLVSGFNDSPAGLLRVSCNPYFAETRLLKIIEKYIEEFPNVNIDILTEERMPDIEREQIDIVFGVNWPAPPDVVAKMIGETRYVLCASPEYLKKYGVPADIKELENHNYIPHLGRTSENIIANLKNRVKLTLDPRLKLNNAHFMKQCALSNLGIIQLHDYMIENELKNSSLVEILSEYLKPKIPLYVYYQKHRFVQPKIRKFITLITEYMSGQNA